MPDVHLNYWAVAVAAFATFMLGGAWYTALFGKTWQRLHGYSEEKVKAMQTARPPAVFFSVMLISYFVLAIAVGVVFSIAGVQSAVGGAALGFVLWLGLCAAIGATEHIASDRHIGVYMIDRSYQLLSLVMIGVIIGAWK